MNSGDVLEVVQRYHYASLVSFLGYFQFVC